MTIAGLIMAGGRSTRYGKQKLFELHENEALWMKSVRALQKANIHDIYVLTNDTLNKHFLTNDVHVLIDHSPHAGPLHALHGAMNALHEDFEWFQVLAGDLPTVHHQLLLKLQNNLSATEDCDCLLPINNGKLQPLHGLYHRNCLRVLQHQSSDDASMRQLIERVNTRTIDFSNKHDFININYEHDWKGVQR
ncbi:hypothetical protein DH09_01530 [Bacillaceae bacterium JMAK1]|nr:hypothetical protein DH09_01530 [Bacillaceae bacterium JMAK1]